MGGYGSGRRSTRPVMEECHIVRLSDLRRWGKLLPDHWIRCERHWTRYGETSGNITIVTDTDTETRSGSLHLSYRSTECIIEQNIALVGVPMPFGGWRWLAICPHTGLRCTTLVLSPGENKFLSRRALCLPYRSQRSDEVGRAQLAIDKSEARLGRLSKYARTRTRDRLWDRITAKQAIVDREIQKMTGVLHRTGTSLA